MSRRSTYPKVGPANSHQKHKIRPAPKLTEAARALHTISSTSQVQIQVPSADMVSHGEPSGRILSPLASNLSSNATLTQLLSPVTDSDTNQDVEMTQATTEANSTDGKTACVWVESVESGWHQLKTLYILTYDNRRHDSKKLSKEEIQGYIKNMRAYLLHLLHEVEPKPEFKKLGLDKALAFYLPPEFPPTLARVAPDLSILARQVLEKYESEDWGKDFTTHQGEESEAEDLGSAVATTSTTGRNLSGSRPSTKTVTEDIPLPPVSHPIWGLQGIMHGVARKTTKTGRVVPVLDPRYLSEKCNAKAFGHNGHKPGAWWAYMMAALFHGVHGSPQHGITGHAKFGAYSIVVSANSVYRDLNEDKGTELWYSADKSTENANPTRIETSPETRSLEMSLENGKPVRVLRKAGNTSDARHSPIYPTVGIRYDGLYKVVDQEIDTNKHGGAFKKFQLVRLPDSDNAGVSWEEVQRYPTREQIRQFDKIKDGY